MPVSTNPTVITYASLRIMAATPLSFDSENERCTFLAEPQNGDDRGIFLVEFDPNRNEHCHYIAGEFERLNRSGGFIGTTLEVSGTLTITRHPGGVSREFSAATLYPVDENGVYAGFPRFSADSDECNWDYVDFDN
ncbi:hypothetical protein BGX21_005088 [Mortierella sp. AD011]|nr:hypothetical protein BGX20_002235 [Mortierella sp. AD010]KAF9400053.1 hypothetical protein BGX21_005088 [Mortierella sp. AD011]